ncbi:MAG: hypothetical protein IKS46_06000, partial [Clostridia bacterium]|nr:hypothetical protein [Clostridia bacterium]
MTLFHGTGIKRKNILVLLVACVLGIGGLSLPALAEEDDIPEPLRSGDWRYQVLEDGTIGIY